MIREKEERRKTRARVHVWRLKSTDIFFHIIKFHDLIMFLHKQLKFKHFRATDAQAYNIWQPWKQLVLPTRFATTGSNPPYRDLTVKQYTSKFMCRKFWTLMWTKILTTFFRRIFFSSSKKWTFEKENVIYLNTFFNFNVFHLILLSFL